MSKMFQSHTHTPRHTHTHTHVQTHTHAPTHPPTRPHIHLFAKVSPQDTNELILSLVSLRNPKRAPFREPRMPSAKLAQQRRSAAGELVKRSQRPKHPKHMHAEGFNGYLSIGGSLLLSFWCPFKINMLLQNADLSLLSWSV